jgi:adenosylcobinamide-phosphate synthase
VIVRCAQDDNPSGAPWQSISPARRRALILLLAVALDLLAGEPPNRWHPVAWLGTLAARLERRAPSGGRLRRLAYGAGLTAALVGGSACAGAAIERALRRQPRPTQLLVLAVALKSSFSARGLPDAATLVAAHLATGNLPAARASLGALVSRPTDLLEADQVASAAIESVAENLSDSVVAPMLAYLVAGLPGAFGYRAVNTLDAMIGYHGAYEDLGKVAARLDDLANLLPARLSALLLLAAATLGFGEPRAACQVLWRDHSATESPNAGWPMSAAAGALQVRLAKLGHYQLGAELPPPTACDVERSVRLYYASAAIGLALMTATALVIARLGPLQPECAR